MRWVGDETGVGMSGDESDLSEGVGGVCKVNLPKVILYIGYAK